jgi:hypothetical protein
MIPTMMMDRSISNRHPADSGIWPRWSKSSGPTIKPFGDGSGRASSPDPADIEWHRRTGSIGSEPDEMGEAVGVATPTASVDSETT